MGSLKGKKILMVLAFDQYRDEEYEVPAKIFREEGAKVMVASTSLGEAEGKLGGKVEVDILLDKVNCADYEVVVFVGGPGAEKLFDNHEALRIAKEMRHSRKVVAAICIAPMILANAKLLGGKKATAFPSIEEALREKGVDYTGDAVTKDGKLVTANGPEAAEKFAHTVIHTLQKINE